MHDLSPARKLHRQGGWSGGADCVVLTYDQRFLRRRKLHTQDGAPFLVDLAQTTSVNQGDAFELDDGKLVEVIAAQEDLLEVRGDLIRLAWHIGNRHTPAQIEPSRILIQRDHVLKEMLATLGASLSDINEPFTPEGGAYGHGRTHSHGHGHDEGGHGADHSHSATHAHGHSHSHDH